MEKKIVKITLYSVVKDLESFQKTEYNKVLDLIDFDNSLAEIEDVEIIGKIHIEKDSAIYSEAQDKLENFIQKYKKGISTHAR